MARIVDIPKIGEVEFPDSMTDEQIVVAIQKLMGGTQQSASPSAPPSPAAPTAPQPPSLLAPTVTEPTVAPVSPPVVAPPVAPVVVPQAPRATPPLSLFAPRVKVQQDKLPFESIAEMGATPSAAFTAGTQTDKNAAIKEFAKARGIPASRYRIVGNDIVYEADDGKFYAEVPGILKAPKTSIAYNAPDVLEAIPGLVTGLATSPMIMAGPAGIAGSVALTGGAAALANAGRQKYAGLLAGEDRPLDIPQVATSGLLDAVAQAIPVGRLGMFNARSAADLAKLDISASNKMIGEANRFGIQLTPAEITNLPSLKAQQKVLGNIAESSDTLGKFYEKRYQEQIQPAVDDFLGYVSRVDDPMTAGLNAQNALKQRKEVLNKEREDIVSPLYTEAFKNATPVNTSGIVSQLDRMLEIAKGDEKRELLKIKDAMFRDVTETLPDGSTVTKKILDDRLPALQRVKFSIDSALEGDAVGAMDKTIKGEITGIKKQLVDAMSEGNPLYREANDAFEAASAPINEFMSSRAGFSLTEVSRDNLNQFATRLFKDSSPQTVTYIRNQVEAANPGAWKDVTRAWLQQNWEKATEIKPGARDLPVDAGANWKNILLGTEKNKRILQAALEPEEYRGLVDLTEVLGAAGRVKKIGSDTAFNEKVLADMGAQSGGLLTTLGKVAGSARLDAPLKFVADFASKRQFGQNAESVANIITSPDGILRLRELRKMSPTSVGFWSGLSQLVVDFSKPPVEDFFTDYGNVPQ